ncbi:MAG: glutamate formimidoyltransferase [Armatimonadetes bacterium]|nr:glutamate formimidoyltransferase [Armatimonadota bacterium]
MKGLRLLCVPNFSEGRRPKVLQAIRDAIASHRVEFHGEWPDADHNRTVFAYSGLARHVAKAVIDSGMVAREMIDLNKHEGAHPRIGALDVMPFVLFDPAREEEAVIASHRIAKRYAKDVGTPVYLYEQSAKPGRIADLPTLRKGEFEGWVGQTLNGLRKPDYGGSRLHPTAGATIMGVRRPLAAFNVNLTADDLQCAKEVAKQVRELRDTEPELTGVRAIGVWLPQRGHAQISLNLSRLDATNVTSVFHRICELVWRQGGTVTGSELIGVLFDTDAAKALGASLDAGIAPQQIIETQAAASP